VRGCNFDPGPKHDVLYSTAAGAKKRKTGALFRMAVAACEIHAGPRHQFGVREWNPMGDE
jgi:hypothetical protein